jgi:predicted transcriptional regulator YheO
VAAIGASIVQMDEAVESDVVLEWDGEPAFAVRLGISVEGMVAAVESEFGGKLGELDRNGKQAALRVLDERGAFAIRRAIEDVADAMGVSRITIYNYLNVIRG